MSTNTAAKTLFILKVEVLRSEVTTEGVKNYGGIYPYAYATMEAAIEKASKLTASDRETFGRPVRSFGVIDVKVGEKSWKALLDAKKANPSADVPLHILVISANGMPDGIDNVKLYNGVYTWAYADGDAADEKAEALNADVDRTIDVWTIKGVAGLKDFLPRQAAPAPAPAPARATVTPPSAACSCGGNCRPFTASVNGQTADGARITGVVAGLIDEGE